LILTARQPAKCHTLSAVVYLVLNGWLFQWRRFNFFDKELLKDGSGNEAFDKLKVKFWHKTLVLLWYAKPKPRFFSESMCYRNIGFYAVIDDFLAHLYVK